MIRLSKTFAKWSIAVLAMTLVVGCSGLNKPSNPNNLASNNQGQTNAASNNSTANSQSSDPENSFILDIMQSAKQGKVFNCDIPIKSTNIESVQKAWGKPDQEDYIAEAKGTYVTYSGHYVVFGFNKGGQIFEVRSLASHQFVASTVSEVKRVLGTPDYDVISNGQQIIGYQAGSEFKIEMVFPLSTTNNPNTPMDHYNVLYPQGTVNGMANDPGRQW